MLHVTCMNNMLELCESVRAGNLCVNLNISQHISTLVAQQDIIHQQDIIRYAALKLEREMLQASCIH